MSGKLNVITVSRLVETTARIEKIILYSRKHHLDLIHLFKIDNSKVVRDYSINKYKRYSTTIKYLL